MFTDFEWSDFRYPLYLVTLGVKTYEFHYRGTELRKVVTSCNKLPQDILLKMLTTRFTVDKTVISTHAF